jgi:hypothetical protein
MKLGLKKKQKTEQLNFRIEASLKQELTELFKECAAKEIDTADALSKGLRQVATALRRELAEVSDATTDVKVDGKTDANSGAKKRSIPTSQSALPNGTDADRA